MPVRKEYTAEFKEQAVRFVFEEIGPDESRSAAVERLGPKLNVQAGDVDELGEGRGAGRRAADPGGRAASRSCGRRTRRCARRTVSWLRANEILQAAASFFGAALDRQSKR